MSIVISRELAAKQMHMHKPDTRAYNVWCMHMYPLRQCALVSTLLLGQMRYPYVPISHLSDIPLCVCAYVVRLTLVTRDISRVPFFLMCCADALVPPTQRKKQIEKEAFAYDWRATTVSKERVKEMNVLH